MAMGAELGECARAEQRCREVVVNVRLECNDVVLINALGMEPEAEWVMDLACELTRPIGVVSARAKGKRSRRVSTKKPVQSAKHTKAA